MITSLLKYLIPVLLLALILAGCSTEEQEVSDTEAIIQLVIIVGVALGLIFVINKD